MDNLANVFKGNNLKLTPQRIAVYNCLKNTKEHPSAEIIYKTLHENYPTMSLATVYKALKTMMEVGLVQELNVGEGNFRYDIDTSSHPHIQCLSCGRVDDINGICFSRLNNDVQKYTNYDVTANQVYFYGLCDKCKQKES